MKLKAISFFIAIFAICQFGQSEKAYASVSAAEAQKSSKFEGIIHGNGCGGSRCMSTNDASVSDRSV
jgi:hypothetical protein